MNNTTEIIFILDRSGSMSGLEADTIGGYNSLLSKQKEETGEAVVSTILFNEKSVVVHDRVPIQEVPNLTSKDYVPSGCTALLDAIGDAIHYTEKVHHILPEDLVPSKTLFVVTTDGMENSSKKFSYETIRNLVEAKTEEKWQFIFLGANIDAISVAAKLGIDSHHAAQYECDAKGTNINFAALSCLVSASRKASKKDFCDLCEDQEWKEDIEMHLKKSNKKSTK